MDGDHRSHRSNFQRGGGNRSAENDFVPNLGLRALLKRLDAEGAAGGLPHEASTAGAPDLGTSQVGGQERRS